MAREGEELIAAPESGDETAGARSRRSPPGRAVLLGLLAVLVAAFAIVWSTRERIAENVISGQLESLGVPATYRIESIGARRQIVTDLVIGDPRRPDLTVERVILEPRLRFGVPGVGRLTLVKPRLYGSYLQGKLSFGSLDAAIFAEGEEPFRLPDLDLTLIDGRALIESDFGPVGVRADGNGPLRGGFSGRIAAMAPELTFGGCRAERASLYGRLAVSGERPHFRGPVRLAELQCPANDVRFARAVVEADITADRALDGADGSLALQGGPLAYGNSRIAGSGARASFTYRKDMLTARFDLQGRGISSPQVAAAGLGIEGRLRALDGFARLEIEGAVEGDRLNLGRDPDRALASLGDAASGSLVADLSERLRAALRREGRTSELAASFILRSAGGATSLVVPSGTLRGSSGAALLSVSRVKINTGDRAPPIAGNFATGGPGLPQIAGRMEGAPGGGLVMRVRMTDYRAGSARLALPRLMIAQAPGGGVGFAGEARVSGAVPGGRAENIVIPLGGSWSEQGGLSLWRNCVKLRFDRLELAQVVLKPRKLPVCPPRGGAIVRSAGGRLTIAGGVPRMDLTGRLGQTPIRIASGPVDFARPGALRARGVNVALGPADTASHFRIARLDAHLGGEVSGTFESSEIKLGGVPLDILETSGRWRFARGTLSIEHGAFRLEDREQVDRFQPLVARDGALRLANDVIDAEAVLREPRSGREIVRTRLRHDLSTGAGGADLAVEGVLFDKQLQPDTLTALALGVIANARGVVRGEGRIDWNEQGVTSSGRFATDDLDFAAAFGPVQGLSGTVRFTDLLGLVTEPGQRLAVASVNPGIEVSDGVLVFALRPGNILAIEGAKWPFQGGALTLEPVTIAIGSDHVIRYNLNIEGMDAALFVQHLELSNIAATGTFDGRLPLVFDENGGRIEGGYLVSRAPGGNVSYVGELTYDDLSPMANFAFDALRSLDYRQMRITLDGSLEGEIITRVTFDGIRQGEGATRNFVTRRIARLPIRFIVNIRAPFFQLVTSVRSLYDPEYVRDPRTIGLLDSLGRPRPPFQPGPPDLPSPAPAPAPPAPIQRSESDDLR